MPRAYGPAVIFALALVALTVVIVTGHDPGVLVSLISPVVAGLFVANKVEAVHDVTRQVQHQTNGALDARIERAVARAVKNGGGGETP